MKEVGDWDREGKSTVAHCECGKQRWVRSRKLDKKREIVNGLNPRRGEEERIEAAGWKGQGVMLADTRLRGKSGRLFVCF